MIMGTRYAGYVRNSSGQLIATRFFHIGFLAIIPIEGVLVTRYTNGSEKTEECPLYGRSVIAGLFRLPLTISMTVWSIQLARELFSPGPMPDGLIYMVVFYFSLLLVWMWVALFYNAKRAPLPSDQCAEQVAVSDPSPPDTL